VGPRPYVAGLKHSAESPRPPERSTNSGAAIWCRWRSATLEAAGIRGRSTPATAPAQTQARRLHGWV